MTISVEIVEIAPLVGKCINKGNSVNLEEGVLYYLFEHGPNHYYVSRFKNKGASMGAYQRIYFEIVEDELPKPPIRPIDVPKVRTAIIVDHEHTTAAPSIEPDVKEEREGEIDEQHQVDKDNENTESESLVLIDEKPDSTLILEGLYSGRYCADDRLPKKIYYLKPTSSTYCDFYDDQDCSTFRGHFPLSDFENIDLIDANHKRKVIIPYIPTIEELNARYNDIQQSAEPSIEHNDMQNDILQVNEDSSSITAPAVEVIDIEIGTSPVMKKKKQKNQKDINDNVEQLAFINLLDE